MNADQPVVLISSGSGQTDSLLREGLASAFPNLEMRIVSGSDELPSVLAEVQVLLAWRFPFDRLKEARKLKWMQLLGAGLDSLQGIDLPVGLQITNIRGVFGPEMAEYAIAYMLAHEKNLFGFREHQRQHMWTPKEPGLLKGKTVGVIGLGSIGRVVVERCLGFGMRVIGLNRTGGTVSGLEHVYTTSEIDDLLPQCDYLVFVLPSTSETRGLITRERFRLMKPGVFLVSMGRGDVLDEQGLVEALRSGRLSGAALDVFSEEPVPPTNRLWDEERLFITPHIAGISRPEELLPVLKSNLAHYLQGEALENLVDLKRGY